jgi:hypothetical protein
MGNVIFGPKKIGPNQVGPNDCLGRMIVWAEKLKLAETYFNEISPFLVKM